MPSKRHPSDKTKNRGDFTTQFAFTVVFDENTFSYTLVIKHNFQDNLCRVDHEILSYNGKLLYEGKNGEGSLLTDDGKERDFLVDWDYSGIEVVARFNSKIRNFVAHIGSKCCAVSLNPFLEMGKHSEKNTVLALTGSNFFGWHDYLRDLNISAMFEVHKDCAEFISGFKQIAFRSQGDVRSLVVEFSPSQSEDIAYTLSFDELSHGQKILCIFYMLLRTAEKNATICIDEFENFLSPSELQPIYDLIQDMMEEKSVQFILVSHHEKTLNWFHDAAVLFTLDGFPPKVRVEEDTQDCLSIVERVMGI